jgi:hypothetical protein
MNLACSLVGFLNSQVGDSYKSHLEMVLFYISCYTFSMEFEWDPRKADANHIKHQVSFHEAATVFSDPSSITIPDPDHSMDEDRFIIVGLSYHY